MTDDWHLSAAGAAAAPAARGSLGAPVSARHCPGDGRLSRLIGGRRRGDSGRGRPAFCGHFRAVGGGPPPGRERHTGAAGAGRPAAPPRPAAQDRPAGGRTAAAAAAAALAPKCHQAYSRRSQGVWLGARHTRRQRHATSRGPGQRRRSATPRRVVRRRRVTARPVYLKIMPRADGAYCVTRPPVLRVLWLSAVVYTRTSAAHI